MKQMNRLNYWIQRAIPFVYDDTLSLYELVAKTVAYLNNVIESQNDLAKEVADFLDRFDGDLTQTVTNILNKWLSDGTLAQIINDDVFNMKLDKSVYEENKSFVNKRFNDYQELNDSKVDANTQTNKQQQKSINNFKMRSTPLSGLIDFNQFQDITLKPSFNVWRNVDGSYSHDYQLHTSDYQDVYIKKDGDDSNNGLTPSTPMFSLEAALRMCESHAASKFVINIESYNSRNELNFTRAFDLTKDYKITSKVPIYPKEKLEFTRHQKNTWVATTSYRVSGVLNEGVKGVFGMTKELEYFDTLNIAMRGVDRWTQVGDKLYVNTKDLANIGVGVSAALWQFDILGRLDIVDIEMFGGSGNNNLWINSKNNPNTNYSMFNLVRSKYRGLSRMERGPHSNGVTVDNISDVNILDCVVSNSLADGLNYHSTSGTPCKVLEVNCIVESSGLNSNVSTLNASTGHDGITLYRVGSKYHKSHGPMLADVNGCKSVIIGVECVNAGLTTGSRSNSAMYFDNTSGGNSIVYIVDCVAGSDYEHSISTDLDHPIQKIKYYNSTLLNVIESIALEQFNAK